jgi:hypothetical protein
MGLKNVSFEDRSIERARLELSDKDALYYLGPNLVLRHCTLVLRVPTQRLHLPGSKFIDCTIEVKRELKDLSWYTTFLKGCRFTGRLTGCDFGHWPDPESWPNTEEGGIEDCDFTAAQLHLCRFVGCDVNTLRLPRWPYFTIEAPFRRRHELASIAWPGKVGGWIRSFELYPETTVAVTFSATELSKESAIAEGAIKAVLTGLDGIIY